MGLKGNFQEKSNLKSKVKIKIKIKCYGVTSNLLASTPHFGILGLTVERDVPNLKW